MPTAITKADTVEAATIHATAKAAKAEAETMATAHNQAEAKADSGNSWEARIFRNGSGWSAAVDRWSFVEAAEIQAAEIGESNAWCAIDQIGGEHPTAAESISAYRQNVVDTLREKHLSHCEAAALQRFDDIVSPHCEAEAADDLVLTPLPLEIGDQLSNGIVIAITEKPIGMGDDIFGVLCMLPGNSFTPYVTWYANSRSRTAECGNYFQSIAAASRDFGERFGS